MLAHQRYESALSILNTAIQTFPDSCRAYLFRGIARCALHMRNSGIDDLNEVFQHHPSDDIKFETFLLIGENKSINRDHEGSRDAYQSALKIRPNAWLAYYYIASDETSQNDLDNAWNHLDSALKYKPDLWGAYNLRGYIRYYRGDTVGGIKEFTYAISKDSLNSVPYLGRIHLEIELKDYTGAMEDIKKAFILGDSSNALYLNLGDARQGLKDTVGAMEDFSKAVSLDPYFPVSYFHRGCLEEAMKKYTDAITDFTKAMSIYPEYVPYYTHRGICNIRLGKKEDACNDFHKAESMNPDNTEAKKLSSEYCK